MKSEARRREYFFRVVENLLLDIDRDDLSTAQMALKARQEIDRFFKVYGLGIWGSVMLGINEGELPDDE